MGKKTDGGGLRFNTGKLDLSYCPTSMIAAVSSVLACNSEQYGGKYPDNNWRRGMKWMTVANCAMRHLIKWMEGEELDEESKLPHLYHVATNIAFLVEYKETCPDLDDRYKDSVTKLNVIQNEFKNALEAKKK